MVEHTALRPKGVSDCCLLHTDNNNTTGAEGDGRTAARPHGMRQRGAFAVRKGLRKHELAAVAHVQVADVYYALETQAPASQKRQDARVCGGNCAARAVLRRREWLAGPHPRAYRVGAQPEADGAGEQRFAVGVLAKQALVVVQPVAVLIAARLRATPRRACK